MNSNVELYVLKMLCGHRKYWKSWTWKSILWCGRHDFSVLYHKLMRIQFSRRYLERCRWTLSHHYTLGNKTSIKSEDSVALKTAMGVLSARKVTVSMFLGYNRYLPIWSPTKLPSHIRRIRHESLNTTKQTVNRNHSFYHMSFLTRAICGSTRVL